MLKAANGHGLINHLLKTKSKDEIMNIIDETTYYYETIKKLAVRIIIHYNRKKLFTLGELLDKSEDELFEIIETNK
jgi:hypothetical protein